MPSKESIKAKNFLSSLPSNGKEEDKAAELLQEKNSASKGRGMKARTEATTVEEILSPKNYSELFESYTTEKQQLRALAKLFFEFKAEMQMSLQEVTSNEVRNLEMSVKEIMNLAKKTTLRRRFQENCILKDFTSIAKDLCTQYSKKKDNEALACMLQASLKTYWRQQRGKVFTYYRELVQAKYDSLPDEAIHAEINKSLVEFILEITDPSKEVLAKFLEHGLYAAYENKLKRGLKCAPTGPTLTNEEDIHDEKADMEKELESLQKLQGRTMQKGVTEVKDGSQQNEVGVQQLNSRDKDAVEEAALKSDLNGSTKNTAAKKRTRANSNKGPTKQQKV